MSDKSRIRTSAPVERFKFRFGMRLLIVVVSLLAVALGFVTNKAHQQRTAVNWVRANGGMVTYDFDRTLEDLPGPGWAHSLFGVDFFAVPVGVSLNYALVEDITPLSRLRQLDTVLLTGTFVGDVTPLSHLNRVETLQHDVTEVTDVLPLMKLRQLQYLNLSGNNISKDDLERLQSALPKCRIDF